MDLYSPQHLKLQKKWEAKLAKEGLTVLLATPQDIDREDKTKRRMATRSEDEVSRITRYYEAAIQYLDLGRFAAGERKVWKLHAETGLGRRNLAQQLGLSVKRVENILTKHRQLCGIVSPYAK